MAPSSRRALATCALYALLSSVFCLPFDAARHPEFQRLPFWMWEYPQAPILTPAWILSALLPASWAIAINLIAHYWIALVGMHLLVTRAIGLRFLPFVVVTSSIFALSGAAALHVAAGDAGFLSLLYLPLILFFVYRSTETGLARHAIGAAALAALTVYDGGFHAAPIALSIVIAWTACLAVASRDWRPLIVAAVTIAGAAAFAAPKLIPAVEFAAQNHEVEAVVHPDRTTADMLWRAYTDASISPDAHVSGAQRHDWWEYGNYIGLAAVVTISIGIAWPFIVASTPRRAFAMMLSLMAVWFLVLSAGEFHAFAPAVAVSHLPWPSSLPAWSDYTIAFVLFGTLAAAISATHVAPSHSRRLAVLVVAIAGAMAIGQMIVGNQRQFRFAATSTSAVHPIAPPEPLRLSTEGSATLSDVVTTFNGVRFSVVGGFEPSRIALNQQYVPGWTSSAGPIVLDPRNAAAMFITLGAGRTGTFSFTFLPPGFTIGLTLLLAAVVVSFVGWRREWTAVAYGHATARGAAPPFAERAERASKAIVVSSMAAAVVARALVGGDNQADLIAVVIGSFVAWRVASAWWDDADGLVLSSMLVAPAVFAHFWTHDGSVYSMYLAAGLLGATWRRSRARWSLPAAWRVPLVLWALTVAVGWPIVALREVDFHPEIGGILGMPNSLIGVNAGDAIAIASDAAAVLLLGVVWLDWLFQRYAGDLQRFKRAVMLPLIVSGSIASAVAAYQLFIDIRFLNAGWAVFHRASGTMVDANGFGMAAVLCSCACLALIDRGNLSWNRAMLGGFALTLLGAWSSGSRTALVAAVIALAAAAWSMLRRSSSVADDRSPSNGRALAIAAAAVTAAAVLWALRDTGPVLRLGWIVPSASIESVKDFARQMLLVRFGYGTAAVKMIRSSPWFGVGVGSFPVLVGDFPLSHFGGPLMPDNAQNWIRHNVAELGLVGSLGWIVWTVAMLSALVRRSAAWRDTGTMIVAGALIGLILVSQVGMPTQNPAVGMLFWTFVFWLCASRWPSADAGPAPAWSWALAVMIVAGFAAGTLWTSATMLRPPLRARNAGWPYDYGYYLPERTATGEEFRWTNQDAVAVIPAGGRNVRLTVWGGHIDPAHPVMARVWHDQQLIIDTVLHDDRPVSTDVVIDKDPQWLMIRTYLDRNLPEPQADLGLAVQWTFSAAPRR